MFTENDVICVYTREQAIEDGLLFPVETNHFERLVVTVGIRADFEGEELEGLVAAAAERVAEVREKDPNETLFDLLAGSKTIWCEIDGEGVATIMYPDER